MDGTLRTGSTSASRREIITASEGITGRFSRYDVQAVPGSFWKVDYQPTSVTLEAVRFLAGDYDDNLIVDQGDLDLVLLNWGNGAMTVPDTWLNDQPSGIIDQEELDRVLLNWGDVLLDPSRPIAGAGAVPEPGTLGMLVVWLLVALSCRCRFMSAGSKPTSCPR